MNCPKCGYPIYQGDIACRSCHMPVMAMNSIPKEQAAPKQEIKREVANIQTPYIEPTRVEPSYIPKDMIQPVPKVEHQKEQKEYFNNYGEGKKAITSIKFLLPILIGVIVLALVIYGTVAFISTLIDDNRIDPGRDEIVHYQIEFDNFLYTIPNEYIYQKEKSTQTLHISDSDSSWTSSIQVMDATYSSIRSRKASLKSYFQSIGYTVGEVFENTYGSTSFLTIEAKKDRNNYILAVSKAGDSSKSFGIVIKTNDNKINYGILELVSEITAKAEYQNSINSSDKVVDYDFSSIFK